MNPQALYHFLMRIYRHAITHFHEIVVALMVEGSHVHVAMFLALIGVMFLIFAFQVFITAEAE